MIQPRACLVCGTSLEGRRREARYCSGACRREANRIAHLLAGQPDSGYRTLGDYVQRRQRRANGPGGA
jgi:hypothetical protein